MRCVTAAKAPAYQRAPQSLRDYIFALRVNTSSAGVVADMGITHDFVRDYKWSWFILKSHEIASRLPPLGMDRLFYTPIH